MEKSLVQNGSGSPPYEGQLPRVLSSDPRLSLDQTLSDTLTSGGASSSSASSKKSGDASPEPAWFVGKTAWEKLKKKKECETHAICVSMASDVRDIRLSGIALEQVVQLSLNERKTGRLLDKQKAIIFLANGGLLAETIELEYRLRWSRESSFRSANPDPSTLDKNYFFERSASITQQYKDSNKDTLGRAEATLIEWSEICGHEEYEKRYSDLSDLYQSNPEFRNKVHAAAEIYMKSLGRDTFTWQQSSLVNKVMDLNPIDQCAVRYMLKEAAGLYVMAAEKPGHPEKQFGLLLYPGNLRKNPAIEYILEKIQQDRMLKEQKSGIQGSIVCRLQEIGVPALQPKKSPKVTGNFVASSTKKSSSPERPASLRASSPPGHSRSYHSGDETNREKSSRASSRSNSPQDVRLDPRACQMFQDSVAIVTEHLTLAGYYSDYKTLVDFLNDRKLDMLGEAGKARITLEETVIPNFLSSAESLKCVLDALERCVQAIKFLYPDQDITQLKLASSSLRDNRFKEIERLKDKPAEAHTKERERVSHSAARSGAGFYSAVRQNNPLRSSFGQGWQNTLKLVGKK